MTDATVIVPGGRRFIGKYRVDGVLGEPVLSVDGQPWEETAGLLAAARAATIGAP